MRASERMRGKPEPAGTRTAAEAARAIEPVVLALIEAQERLIALFEAHRAAIARADAAGLAAVIEAERETIERIARLEGECRAALGLTGAAHTVTTLAKEIGGPEGARLGESASYLRALVTRSHAMQAAIGEASRAVSLHLSGLMRQVAARLSHAGTYGAQGRVESRAAVVTGLDMSL